jgi:hypothetical protein
MADPKLITDLIQWNKIHPIGTPVSYWDHHQLVITTTKSEAWIAPNGQPVIQVEASRGSIPLGWISCRKLSVEKVRLN